MVVRMPLAVIAILGAVFGGIVYFTMYSPRATACRDQGGTYFLDGECVKINLVPVEIK